MIFSVGIVNDSCSFILYVKSRESVNEPSCKRSRSYSVFDPDLGERPGCLSGDLAVSLMMASVHEVSLSASLLWRSETEVVFSLFGLFYNI